MEWKDIERKRVEKRRKQRSCMDRVFAVVLLTRDSVDIFAVLIAKVYTVFMEGGTMLENITLELKRARV